jgi:hypothetical protein
MANILHLLPLDRAKLVDNPADAAPFLPKLIPELEKTKEEVADPECRQVGSVVYCVWGVLYPPALDGSSCFQLEQNVDSSVLRQHLQPPGEVQAEGSLTDRDLMRVAYERPREPMLMYIY